MLRTILLAVVVGVLARVAASAELPPAHVDDRVELLTIVARLAGAREYSMPNSASPYAERVAARFGPHAQHAAITTYQKIRAAHGASYDAIPSLALHLDGVPSLAPRMPFSPRPERLDARWDHPETAEFLVALRDFAAVTDAAEFFASERPFYGTVETRLSEFAAASNAVPWFDQFFGMKPGATYQVIPGLLCGGGNFGVGVAFGDGSPEEIRPVLGCWEWDSAGIPRFTIDAYLPTYVHELCHSYTNRIVDAHASELDPPAARIYPAVAPQMQRMAYATPRTMMYESLVRACVIRFLKERRGNAEAATEGERDAKSGFTWVPDLAALLDTYVANRSTYPTFEAFVPEIVTFFNRRADSIAAQAAERSRKAPTIVAMTPANGATDVDPALTTMTITFDRPMRDGSWSFVGGRETTPEIVGTPSYDAAATTLTATVKLRPGATYDFHLNSERFTGFQAKDGTALQPVHVRFSVAPAK